MAYNDRSGIRSKVIEYLDGRTDLDSKVNSWIDDTRRDMANTYDFSYLYVEATCETSAGTERYALPADYLGHLNMFIGTKKLVRIAPGVFDSVHGDTSDLTSDSSVTPFLMTTGSLEQSEPDYYIDRGVEFDLWPIPDDTYTLLLRYYAQPQDFIYDYSYDYLTTFHTECVIFGAAYRGAIYLEDDSKKGQYKEEYGKQLQLMVKREKDRKTDDLGHRMRTPKDFNINQLKRLMKVNN